MKLVFLLLYFFAISCPAFAYGLVSSSAPRSANGLTKSIRRAQGASYAYVVSFFLWFLCAQFFDPRSVSPFFFAAAHLAMYMTVTLAAYHSLASFFNLTTATRVGIVTCLSSSACAASAVLSCPLPFIGATTATFLDRYDDLVSLSVFCALYGLICRILRARSKSTLGYAKFSRVLFLIATLALLDLSFLRASESLVFLPIAFIAANLAVAGRFSRESREPLTDSRIALAGVTARERAIINGLMSGYSYAQIADLEFISIHTVKSHARNAYRKLGVATRHQLMALLAR